MLVENTYTYKQIIIDSDKYNALKNLGKTGDSFNKVLGTLINRIKIEGGKAYRMSLIINKIVFISDDVFKVRIDSALRKLGIVDITCYKDWMEMGLRGEDVGIRIEYPDDLDYLPDVIEEEVRFQTSYYESNIQIIKAYISENLELIKGAVKQLK